MPAAATIILDRSCKTDVSPTNCRGTVVSAATRLWSTVAASNIPCAGSLPTCAHCCPCIAAFKVVHITVPPCDVENVSTATLWPIHPTPAPSTPGIFAGTLGARFTVFP